MARVLAPGGAVVSVTHTWAIERRAWVSDRAAAVSTLLHLCGMADTAQRTVTFRSGPGLALQARKPHDRNRITP